MLLDFWGGGSCSHDEVSVLNRRENTTMKLLNIKWKNQLLLLALVPVLLAMVGAAPSMQAAAGPSARPSPFQNIPVSGTVQNVGTFQGTLSIVSFEQGATNNIVASGMLSGVVRDSTGLVVQTLTNEFVSGIPVSFGSAAG